MDGVVQIGGHTTGLGSTQRHDRWWVGPVLTVVGFTGLLGYMTWAAFQGAHYYVGSYLSPLYEPLLFIDAAWGKDDLGPPTLIYWFVMVFLVIGGSVVSCGGLFFLAQLWPQYNEVCPDDFRSRIGDSSQ